jgi:HAD superfamily hydrolase (TIGR01459 family)
MKLHPVPATIGDLVRRYPVLLLDSYGVLVDQSEVLPGAVDLVAHLNRTDKPYFILTNDASSSIAETSRRFYARGMAIPPERIITSGSLLDGYFRRNGLAGCRCVVIGPDGSRRYVAEAGGRLEPLAEEARPDVLVVCDEAGAPLLETADTALTMLFRCLDRGARVRLILPNPDRIYPKGGRRFGLAAGSIAGFLEEALRVRYPGRRDLRFVRLGKPYRAIFIEARRRSGTRDMVMIGDQLATDIVGALRFGLDSALVGTGLSRPGTAGTWPGGMPTYLLRDLHLE